jgi:hypothetical protein
MERCPFLEATFYAIAAGTWEYMRFKQAVVYIEPVDTCPCDSDLMRASIPDRAEPELTPDAAEASEAVSADLNSASIFEAIRGRELALTPDRKETLQPQPSAHWGINE